jgi:hypothetical protein
MKADEGGSPAASGIPSGHEEMFFAIGRREAVSCKELTPEAKERYLKRSGDHCPYCSAQDIEGGPIEVDGGCAWQEIQCHVCRMMWHDVYQLVDVVTPYKVHRGA